MRARPRRAGRAHVGAEVVRFDDLVERVLCLEHRGLTSSTHRTFLSAHVNPETWDITVHVLGGQCPSRTAPTGPHTLLCVA